MEGDLHRLIWQRRRLCLARGIRDLRPFAMPLPMLGITPAVFTAGGLYELVRRFSLDMQSVLLCSRAKGLDFPKLV
jgi:hypothetical protein